MTELNGGSQPYMRPRWPEDTAARILAMREAGMSWQQVAAQFSVAMRTIRSRAKALGVFAAANNRFSPEEDETLAREWKKGLPAEDIAALLGRSVGVIRQRIFHNHRELRGARSPAATRMVRQFGQDALKAGKTPQEARDNIVAAIAKAKSDARHSANVARLARQFAALAHMRERIASGADRNEAIFEARHAGVTLERLGEEFALTRERIRQVCNMVAFARSLQTLVSPERTE